MDTSPCGLWWEIKLPAKIWSAVSCTQKSVGHPHRATRPKGRPRRGGALVRARGGGSPHQRCVLALPATELGSSSCSLLSV